MNLLQALNNKSIRQQDLELIIKSETEILNRQITRRENN